MPDQRKSANVKTGNPPAGRLTRATYTRETFMRDLKKVAGKHNPKK